MVSDGCMPDESTYIILIEGLTHEGYMKEPRELLTKLSSKDVLVDNLIKNDGLLLGQLFTLLRVLMTSRLACAFNCVMS
jgi:hypothetical protein